MVIMQLTPEQFRWMNSDESKREYIYFGFWRELPLLLFLWYSAIGQWSLIVFNCTSVCYFSFIIWICVYFSFQRLNFCAASESFQILLVYFSVWLSDGCVFFFFLIKAHRLSLYSFPYSVCDCTSDVFSCFSLSVGPVFSQSSTRLLIQSPVYQHRAQSS